MRFGDLPLEEADGAYLAHSQRTGSGVIRKGTRLGAAEIAALSAAGLTTVTAARLDPEDLHEDEAARLIAEKVAGPGLSVERADTGRANLYATHPGLVTVDKAAVDALNAIDPAITLATLPPLSGWRRAAWWERSRSSPSRRGATAWWRPRRWHPARSASRLGGCGMWRRSRRCCRR